MNHSAASSCRGKRRHRSRHHANIAVRVSGSHSGDLGLVAYKCPHCPYWHVGHPPKRIQKEIKYRRLIDLIDLANRK